MKALVTRYTVSNMLKETGDDIVFFHVFFKIDELPELRLPIIIPYTELLYFIDDVDKKVGSYLHHIRNGISGYGPKHSIVFKIMQEETFDIEPYIYQYFDSKDDIFFQQHVEWCERLQTSNNKEAVKESVEKLDAIVNDDYINYNIKFNEYKDALDQVIHETTLKYFPDLFEKSKKHIAAYKSKLIDTTLHFSSDIDKIMHDKFNQYWEERYDENNKAD